MLVCSHFWEVQDLSTVCGQFPALWPPVQAAGRMACPVPLRVLEVNTAPHGPGRRQMSTFAPGLQQLPEAVGTVLHDTASLHNVLGDPTQNSLSFLVAASCWLPEAVVALAVFLFFFFFLISFLLLASAASCAGMTQLKITWLSYFCEAHVLPCPSPCCASLMDEHSHGVIPGGGDVEVLCHLRGALILDLAVHFWLPWGVH